MSVLGTKASSPSAEKRVWPNWAPTTPRSADVAMACFHARIPAAVAEDGAGRAVLDFLVLVLGVAEARLDRLQPAAGGAGQLACLAGQGEAVLLHLQAHVGLGGGTVFVAVGAVVGADEAIGPGIGAAQRAAVLLGAGIGQAAVGLARLRRGAGWHAARRCARSRECAGRWSCGQRHRRGWRSGRCRPRAGRWRRALVAAGGGAGVERAADAFHRCLRNAVVDHVDHAADGVAAVHQRGRAAPLRSARPPAGRPAPRGHRTARRRRRCCRRPAGS